MRSLVVRKAPGGKKLHSNKQASQCVVARKVPVERGPANDHQMKLAGPPTTAEVHQHFSIIVHVFGGLFVFRIGGRRRAPPKFFNRNTNYY